MSSSSTSASDSSGSALATRSASRGNAAGAVAERDDFARAEPRLNLRDQLEVAIADQQRLRVRGVDHVLELGILGAIVKRQEREPGLGRRVVAFDVEIGVGVEHRDDVAMREAELFEDRAQAGDLVVQIRVGQASRAEDQDFLFGHDRRRDRDEVNGVHSALPLFQSRRSSSSPCRSGKSRPPQTASLSIADRSRLTRANARAIASARRSKSAKGTTSATIPTSNASWASIQRPVRHRSSARPRPRRRAAVCVPATPGIMPAPVSGRRQARVVGGDREVAEQRHLESAADGVAVDGGDSRDRQRAQHPPYVAAKADPSRDDRRRRHPEFGQVAAGREGLAGAAQHHRANIAIVVDGGEDLEQVVAHRHVVGVELRGTIERDPRDRAALVVENRARIVRFRASSASGGSADRRCRCCAMAGRPRS